MTSLKDTFTSLSAENAALNRKIDDIADHLLFMVVSSLGIQFVNLLMHFGPGTDRSLWILTGVFFAALAAWGFSMTVLVVRSVKMFRCFIKRTKIETKIQNLWNDWCEGYETTISEYLKKGYAFQETTHAIDGNLYTVKTKDGDYYLEDLKTKTIVPRNVKPVYDETVINENDQLWKKLGS